jgi:hypothetical protein
MLDHSAAVEVHLSLWQTNLTVGLATRPARAEGIRRADQPNHLGRIWARSAVQLTAPLLAGACRSLLGLLPKFQTFTLKTSLSLQFCSSFPHLAFAWHRTVEALKQQLQSP